MRHYDAGISGSGTEALGAVFVREVNNLPMKDPYSERIQRLICLLLVLSEIPRRPARKREVLDYIRQRHYLDIQPSDLESYVTQIEPRWNTDIAYRRKDAVENDLLFNSQRDSWELTRSGVEKLEEIKEVCISKKYDVRQCYLWTKQLKKALDPSYQSSDTDKKRPKKIGFKDLMGL
jgi:hypothetical protein